MPEASEIEGHGAQLGLAIGEGIVASYSEVFSGKYKGHNITLGFGLGLMPATVSKYGSNTELGDPVTDYTKLADEYAGILATISDLKESVYEKIKQINTSIDRLSSSINEAKKEIKQLEKLSKTNDNGNDDLINALIDLRALDETHEENLQKIGQLNEQLHHLEVAKKFITEKKKESE